MAWLDLRKQMSQIVKHTQCRQTSRGRCQNYDSLLHRHCFRCPIVGRDSCIPPMARERHSKSGIPQPFRKRRCRQQNSGRRRDVPRHADDDPAKPHAKHLHKWLYRSAISLANKKNNSSPTTKLMLLSFQVATVTGVLQWADKLSKQIRKTRSPYHNVRMDAVLTLKGWITDSTCWITSDHTRYSPYLSTAILIILIFFMFLLESMFNLWGLRIKFHRHKHTGNNSSNKKISAQLSPTACLLAQ